MAQPTRSQRFVQKAEAALLASIEIYNKPDFKYREESFAILVLNAWELLLKAKVLALNGNDPKSLHVYEKRRNKKGKVSKKEYRKRNRAGNCLSLPFGQCITEIEKKGEVIPSAVRRNLDAVIEVRDNATHYVVAGPLLSKKVFEFGTACVANFVRLARAWFSLDLSKYHLYLMPLGFVAPPADAESVLATNDEAKLIKYLSSLAKTSDAKDDDHYQVALTLNIRMKKVATDDAIKVVVTNDPDAPGVYLSEEDFKRQYPWNYRQLSDQLRKRYSDFKEDAKYHQIRKPMKGDARFSTVRSLDPANPRSAKQEFFSARVLGEFDKVYARRSGA